MKRKYLILAAVFALAGCGGNGSSNPAVTTCGLPGGITQVELVYPGSGATGLTNNPGQIITASNSAGFPQNQNWGVQIVTHGGNPANSGLLGGAFGTPINPPFPSPNTPATFANPVYQSSSIASGSLQSGGISYDVYANDASSNCVASQLIGTFTTQ